MRPSKMSRNSQIVILNNSKAKQKNAILFSIVLQNLPTACISGTDWPISVGSVVEGGFANDVYNQSEKLKLNLTDFRLILLGHIA